MNKMQQTIELARKKGVLRAGDLEQHDIPRQYLSRLTKRGMLDRVGRGLYILADADVTEHHTLAEVGRRVPHGVICLLSALRYHGLTTQNPFEVWTAIQNSARRPQTQSLSLRILYLSGEAFTAGIEQHEIECVQVRIYSAAKTVADCFKFRNKIGIDVALEALRDYRAHRDYDADALWTYAKICRVSEVIRPYMEAIV